MDARDQKVVTLASLSPPPSAADESVEMAEAGTPEAEVEVDRALYGRIMQRLQEATDEVGASDVVVTAQDREVSLAQSLLAEVGTETQAPGLGRAGGPVRHRVSTGCDWFRWLGSVADRVRRRDAHPLVRPRSSEGGSADAATSRWR